MDYEKAFGRAKSAYGTGAYDDATLEFIFPELRESGDERIRKFLIDYFTSYKIGNVATKLNGYRIDDILAYLEKQKEQKPVVTHGETYRVDTLGTQQVIAGKMPQKPAEWSEEDENMAYFVNQFLEYHELSDPTAKSCKKWFNNRFKSLRPVGKESLQPHWKPSEEQMDVLLNTEGMIRASGYPENAKVLASLYEALKKL